MYRRLYVRNAANCWEYSPNGHLVFTMPWPGAAARNRQGGGKIACGRMYNVSSI